MFHRALYRIIEQEELAVSSRKSIDDAIAALDNYTPDSLYDLVASAITAGIEVAQEKPVKLSAAALRNPAAYAKTVTPAYLERLICQIDQDGGHEFFPIRAAFQAELDSREETSAKTVESKTAKRDNTAPVKTVESKTAKRDNTAPVKTVESKTAKRDNTAPVKKVSDKERDAEIAAKAKAIVADMTAERKRNPVNKQRELIPGLAPTAVPERTSFNDVLSAFESRPVSINPSMLPDRIRSVLMLGDGGTISFLAHHVAKRYNLSEDKALEKQIVSALSSMGDEVTLKNGMYFLTKALGKSVANTSVWTTSVEVPHSLARKKGDATDGQYAGLLRTSKRFDLELHWCCDCTTECKRAQNEVTSILERMDMEHDGVPLNQKKRFDITHSCGTAVRVNGHEVRMGTQCDAC